MIIQLGVTNVALIRKLNVDISEGMTVLTGETGAGKSIIIDSINMILGDKTRKELVRNGEEKASVQAVFDITDELAEELLAEGNVGRQEYMQNEWNYCYPFNPQKLCTKVCEYSRSA